MNEHLLERIDRYLEGSMSEEEKTAFESEAEGSEELSSLLAIYSGIETEMRENSTYGNQEAALRQTLGRLNTAYFTDVPKQGTEQPDDTTEFHKAEKQEPGESAAGNEEPAPRGQLRSINIRRLLLLAAACIGIILVGIKLWNGTDKNKGGNNQIVKKDSPASAPVTPGIPPDTQALVQQDRPPSHEKEDRPAMHKDPNGGTDTAQRRPSLSPMDRMARTKPAVSPDIDNTALFTANFKPDAAPAVEDRPDALDIAFDSYEAGDYKTAANAFGERDQVSRGGDEDKKLIAFYRHYYQAQIYLAENNATRAIPALVTALGQRPEGHLKVKTQWYLALAYLKNGEPVRAKDLLEKVSRQTQDATLKRKAAAMLVNMKG